MNILEDDRRVIFGEIAGDLMGVVQELSPDLAQCLCKLDPGFLAVIGAGSLSRKCLLDGLNLLGRLLEVMRVVKPVSSLRTASLARPRSTQRVVYPLSHFSCLVWHLDLNSTVPGVNLADYRASCRLTADFTVDFHLDWATLRKSQQVSQDTKAWLLGIGG